MWTLLLCRKDSRLTFWILQPCHLLQHSCKAWRTRECEEKASLGPSGFSIARISPHVPWNWRSWPMSAIWDWDEVTNLIMTLAFAEIPDFGETDAKETSFGGPNKTVKCIAVVSSFTRLLYSFKLSSQEDSVKMLVSFWLKAVRKRVWLSSMRLNFCWKFFRTPVISFNSIIYCLGIWNSTFF